MPLRRISGFPPSSPFGQMKARQEELRKPVEQPSPAPSPSAPTGPGIEQWRTPYAGQFTAPISAQEQYALDEMMAILQGQYDPSSAPWYQARKGLLEGQLGEAQTAQRQRAAMGGMLRSTPAEAEERKLSEQFIRDLEHSAALAEQQRWQQLGGFMGPAALPRALEQHGLESEYQDFMRRQGVDMNILEMIMRMLMMQPGQYQYTK